MVWLQLTLCFSVLTEIIMMFYMSQYTVIGLSALMSGPIFLTVTNIARRLRLQ